MSKKEELVEVYKAANEMEAQVIKSLLESYEIPCLLKSHMALPSPYSPVMNIGEVKVMVWDSMADKARGIIVSDNNV